MRKQIIGLKPYAKDMKGVNHNLECQHCFKKTWILIVNDNGEWCSECVKEAER